MNFNEKELVIFDLDGTLAPSKQPMSSEIGAALGRMLAAKKVAVISGGGFPQFETQFLHSLPAGNEGMANLLLLPTSGTRMLTWKGSWTEEYREDLTTDEKQRIRAALDFGLKSGGYIQPEKMYGEMIEDRGSQMTFSALGQQAPLAAKEAWDPKQEKRFKIVELIKSKLPEFDVRIGGTTSIDITKRGVNKAYGIHKLEAHLKIPIDKMLFVGDALFFGGNDYPAKTTGVDCVQVSGPDETRRLMQSWVG